MSNYPITLSTTEPNNLVGLLKFRQGDKDSQVLNVTVTENGNLFKFNGLAVFFNSVLPNGTVVRDKVKTIDYANSKLTYKVIDSFLQEVSTISAWFSFENGTKVVDSTKNFRYLVEAGWQSCITQGNYIYELSEIQREIEEIIGNKDFTSLITRIGSLESTDTYLKQKTDDLSDKKAEKKEVYDALRGLNDDLSKKKADKEEVYDALHGLNEAVSNKISDLLNGSPKGIYANLSALQIALPSGTTGIYITSDNGNWNYWYSTSKKWVAGGVYQANSKELKDSINAVSEQANAASSSQFSFDKSPMSKGFSNVLVSKFEIGMVNTTDGSTNLDNKRGHSNLFDVTQLDWSNALVNFYPKFSNFKIGIAQYRSDASFISNIGYFDSNKSLKDYTLNPDTTKIRWIVAARDDHTLTQGELDRFSAYVGLLYGKVQLSRSLTALEGEYVDTVYTLDSGGSNTLKKKPLLIFDDISHCRLNTSEILRVGYVANNILTSELVADVILDTSMLGSNSNKAIFYNPDIKTMYVIDGISVSDSNKAISKNCVSLGFVCYPLPQISSTKIQVSVEGKLVLPYDDEYATRLKALEDGVGSKLSGKYISIMGDSISKFKDYGETGTRWGGDTYPSSDVTDVSQMWWKLASDKLGATILTVNANAGSTCTTANPDRIEASSDYRTSRLGVGTKKPDVIICEIGTNDFIYGANMGSFDGSVSLPSTTATFREAYSNMLKKIQANYPDAKIYGCTVHQNLHSGYLTIKNNLQTVVNKDGIKLKELNNVIREVCGLFGAGVIDFESCGLTLANIDKNTKDTAENVHLHPKKAGHAMFADKVVQALR